MVKDDMVFIADVMLGKLAKWLRILGYDCKYYRTISREELLRIQREEGRIILTRDKKIIVRNDIVKFLFIEDNDPKVQVREVIEKLRVDVDPSSLFSRCTICNVKTNNVSRDDVRDSVPPYVFRTQENFYRCPICNKIYWPATHHENVIDRLRTLGIIATI